jgi:tetratricopeptide (TPR) repeat protein
LFALAADAALSEATQGWELLRNGDFKGALKLADSKTIKGKENAAWSEVRAFALSELKDKKAIEEGSKAMSLDPQNAHIVDTYAIILHNNRQLNTAMDMASRAIALDPKDGRAHAVMGICHLTLNDSKQAGSDFAQALQLSPKDFDVNNLAGTYFMQLPQDKESGKKCYDRLVQYFPTSPYARTLRGDCERADNHITQALADYAAALSMNPQFLQAKHSRAILYRVLHRYREALPDYDAVIAAGENKFEGRAECYDNLGDSVKALSDFSSAIKIAGGDKYNKIAAREMKHYKHWWLKRAEIYERIGEDSNALGQLNQILDAEPNTEAALDMRQKIHMRMKQYKEAIKDIDHLIIMGPVAEWYKARANAYDHLGDKIKAAADLKRAQELSF